MSPRLRPRAPQPDHKAGEVPRLADDQGHFAMVALDQGKSDLKELDALVDVLIAGLKAR